LFDVIGQSFAIAQDAMSSLWRESADLVVEPDVAGFGYDDFKRADDLIRSGEVAMRKALPAVRKWMEAPAAESVSANGSTKSNPALAQRPAPMPAD
jgi:hypothetical protein